MNKVLVVLLLLSGVVSYGQDTAHYANEPLSYGVSPVIVFPVLTNLQNPYYSEANRFDNNLGLGFSLWSAYKFDKVWAYGKASFKSFNYGSETVFKIQYGNVDVFAGVKLPSKRLPGLNVVLGYNPIYTLYANRKYLGNSDSISTVNLASQFSNRLSHNVQFGLEFEFKEKNSLEIGLVYNFNRNYEPDYIRGVPHHLVVSYNFNFNRNADLPEDVIAMKNSLYQLKSDTLYVLNKACESDFTHSQLDSLFRTNYTFSSYRILDIDEVYKVSSQPNVVHFAIIGKHYASENDPETLGIYLCDKDLKLTSYPYPNHTYNPSFGNGFNLCLGDLGNTAGHIRFFNKRLTQKLLTTKNIKK